MIGLLPASGRAERINGIPKFAIPTITGEPLIARHARLMNPACDVVRICTTGDWANLVSDLVPDADLRVIAPSTMNDALQRMVDRDDDYLIGMPDTFYSAGNPYLSLAAADGEIAVACWPCPLELRGRVGQVQLSDGRIAGIKDKSSDCEFPYLWGALRLSRDAVLALDSKVSHPGLDLPRLLARFTSEAVLMDGAYVDCGTPLGVREMLNKENP